MSDDDYSGEDEREERPALPAPRHLQPVPSPPVSLHPADEPDRDEVAAVVRQPGERVPVIPVPWRRENIRGTITSSAARNWHRSRYHGLRMPFYAVAFLAWALVGVGRTAAAQVSWWWVTEMTHAMNEHADQGAAGSRDWQRMDKHRRMIRKVRGILLLAEAGVILGGALYLYFLHRPWVWAIVAAVLIPPFAMAGKPDGHKIVSQAVVPPEYERPTHPIIARALGSLGISAIERVLKPDGGGIHFITDVMESGPGWKVQLDLPFGVTAAQIIARRDKLASGLRRPLSATWPEKVSHEHEGRLSLWIGFHDMAKMPPAKWPLARTGTSDLFAGIPFGTDPRGRTVTVPMFEANWLVGGAPGQGKTAAVRLLGLGAALDVRADLWVHELAGKGDLEPLAQVCQRYCSGLDEESVTYAARSASLIRNLLEDRSRAFKALAREAKPEGKITPELALRAMFRPKVVIFDEVQNLFMHPQLGDQAAADIEYVLRLGRAYAIIIILATQRPAKESMPTAISGLVTVRLCYKVPDQVSNDMILGTGAYSAGYNAVALRAGTDAGMGWLRGDADPAVTRGYYEELPAAAKIAARAKAMRERAGVLSGYALGVDDDDVEPRDVLSDVLEAMGADRGVQWGELADRMAERWPSRYHDLTAEAISAQCRNIGVKSVDVKANGAVLKGCRRVTVVQAMTR